MVRVEAAEEGGTEVKVHEGKTMKSTISSKKKDLTIKELVELAINQNPLVYKRLAEI